MPPTISRTSAEPTLYEILSLTPKRLEGQAAAAQQKAIKQAYHKALLKYHPDKNPQDFSTTTTSSSSSSSPKPQYTKPPSSTSGKSHHLTYTVDQIQHAYSILSNTQQRREYDRQLLLTSTSASSSTYLATTEQKHSVSTRFHTGVETVDLDDLGFDERTGVYFGSCRCGNARGFQFTEAELEMYEDDLVLMVQCLDCSLWLRVLFDAAEDEEEEEEGEQDSTQRHAAGNNNNNNNNNSQQPQQPIVSTRNQDTTTTTTTTATAAERRGSHSVSRSGKGWTFNFSFDWGISLSGSTSTSTSTSATANASSRGRV
ncbi:hypothetical protein F4859DRAFT_195883 [Xylaria cf. heliscus]|nr:hypothetical protein F4859DRAFT_195883 [Xylaria cf. heliscus]